MNNKPFLNLTPPVIILSNPQLGENIGAAARAMKNCGFTELRLINPRDGWPNPDAEIMATHASDILQATIVYPNLASACFDITQLFATSARPRELKKKVLNPRMAAQSVVNEYTRQTSEDKGAGLTEEISAQHSYKAAYLFGSERVGLVNDEIVFADFIVEAHLNPKSNSLNLAQAVMIMCWEFSMEAALLPSPNTISQETKLRPDNLQDKRKTLESAATVKEQAYFFNRFDNLLEKKGFFTALEKAPTVKRNMKNFFIKAQLTKQELLTWHGIITLFEKQK